MSESFRIGIIGVSGYGGGEALRIVARHPQFELAAVYGDSSAGTKLGERYPAMAALSPKVANLTITPFEPEAVNVDLLIASMPTGLIRNALAKVPDHVKIVDVGGDHRFVDGWTYGMADLWPERVKTASRIANPGCYPTAAVLAIAPLVMGGLVTLDGPLIIDAKSGVSGAGRGGGEGFGYAEVNESVHGYKALVHGHEPEIRNALVDAGLGESIARRTSFVPHLIPMTRGLLATCYVTTEATANDCLLAARAAYAKSPFVRVTSESPRTKWTSTSNLAFLHYAADPSRQQVVATCAIDNLGKGAAGQAVQNANLMLGLDPATGLTDLPIYP